MRFQYKKICLVAGLAGTLAACNLVDVTDVLPVHEVFEGEAITSVAKAQAALFGTYGILKGTEFLNYYGGNASLMGLTMKPGPNAAGEEAFFDNNVDPQDFNVDAMYTQAYRLLSNTNFILEKTAVIESNDPRKQGIMGEAYFLRALSHFYLLRLYGQFWNKDSKYGIVVKTAPIRNVVIVPRNTVKDTYKRIIDDLDSAIANAPDFTNTLYASKQAAQALKAKVQLYTKDYAGAATTAEAVIRSGKVSLEPVYADIFKKKIVGTKEVLFQLPYDEKSDRNNKAFMFRAYYVPSDYYVNLMKTDNRNAAAITTLANGTVRNNKFNGTVFNGQTLTADTEYFLRLDEIYLIQAEALTRSNNINAGRDTLNVIRKRVAMPLITTTDKAALLAAIRMEKILELGAESGEEWFDLIRFASEGDLKVSDHKASVISDTRYILPMPFETVRLSNKVVEQNPGY